MPKTTHSILFQLLQLGAITLPNRVLMAPLTRNRAHPDGTPHAMAVKYYRQRASAGLIFTEATQIAPLGKGYLNTPGIYSAAHEDAWAEIVDAVHAAGGRIALQLWHAGRISHESLLPDGQAPVAPSAIRANSQTFTASGMTPVAMPRALERAEIPELVAQYAAAAQRAKHAGFDLVEVHAANGYLIDQFLQSRTNERTDEYGGSPANRARFLWNVTAAVADVMGADRVGVRLSPTGTFNDMGDADPETTFATAIDGLNSLKLAFLHVVERFPGSQPTADDMALLARLRERWRGLYLANGGFDGDTATAVIASHHADAVTFGRPFIANPDLPERLRRHAPLNEPDPATFYGGDERGYSDYPALAD